MQIELYDKVQIKNNSLYGNNIYTVESRVYDREGNVMFELIDDNEELLEEEFYPEELIKMEY